MTEFRVNSNICKLCKVIIAQESQRTKKGLITKLYSDQRSRSKKRDMPLPTYSKKWFTNWLITETNFDEMYILWVDSDYDKDIKPSIDRLDDYIGYTETNIQLITARENILKGASDRKEGINNKISKAVVQKTLDGKLIDKYPSANAASRATGISRGNIGTVCRGLANQAGGFLWEFSA